MRFKIIIFIILVLLNPSVLQADVPQEVIGKLSSANPNDRMDACLMLSNLGGGQSIKLLKKHLGDKSMLVRHSAANALAVIGGPKVNDIFKDMIATGNTEKKRLGLAGLAMTGDPGSIDLVLEQLESKDWQVRWSAVYALGEWGCREAIPKLGEISRTDPYQDPVTGEYPVRIRAEQMCKNIMSSIEWYRNFDSGMLLSKKLKKPVWVYWWVKDSEWCKKLEEGVFFCPEVSDLSQNFVCIKLNVEDTPSLVSQCNISGAPFMLILDKNGREIDRVLGYVSKKELLKRLNNALKNKGTPRQWKEALSKNPSDAQSAWFLAEWYMDNGNIKEAIPLLEDVIKNDPNNRFGNTDNAMFTLAYTLGAKSEYEAAIKFLEQLLRNYPKFKDMDMALYCLGLDYLAVGNKEKAKDIFKKLIKEYPGSSSVKVTEKILGEL